MNFWERLDSAIASRSTRKEVAEFLGVTPNTIANWKARQSYPDVADAVRIANFLKVSVEYLVTGEESLNGWVESNKELVLFLQALTPDQLAEVRNRVQQMVAETPKETKWEEYQRMLSLTKFRDQMEPGVLAAHDRVLARLRLDPEVLSHLKEKDRDKGMGY